MTWLSPKLRKWLYGVVTAAVPILVSYGVLADAQAPLWVALGAAVLGTGTAAANTSSKATQPSGVRLERESYVGGDGRTHHRVVEPGKRPEA